MESYQQQQQHSHSYTRPPLLPPPPPPPPPPTSISDPQQYHHHQVPPPQQPPPPGQPMYQQSSVYSNQFQYNPPPPSSSSPLPPHQQQQQQWNSPNPHPLPPGVYHPSHPYPTHHHYPPQPPSHLQSYPRPNQEWGTPNWPHHQGMEYTPVQSNGDDWAARAKAWASAKVSTDYQSVHPQPVPYGRVDEQVQYHDQHQQPVESQYSQSQQQAHASSSYLQFPATPIQRSPSISSGPVSYVPDGHSTYIARDETPVGASKGESLAASQTYQQEVPSSYSSVGGKVGAGAQGDLLYKPSSFPVASHQEGHYHLQSSPAMARPELVDRFFANRNHTADHPTVPSDQPLDFAPRFNRIHEQQMQSGFPQHTISKPLGGLDPVITAPPIHTWPPHHAPETVYHSIPSGSQHDPPLALTSSNTLMGRTAGPGFYPPVSSVSAPFDLGARPALYSTTAFPGEVYGISSISDRPKKAAVPNWLREEIIKKKTVFVNSAHEKNDDTQTIEDEAVEKSIGRSDQEDSKSIDSSKSNEEEDDDEDYVEAARTTAINQEIKRILTEVLLKVTDELFDEIATKVLDEDGVMAEDTSFNQVAPMSSSPATTSTPKASTKALIQLKPVESEARVAALKSSSNTLGDVLGLGSYDSDDDDDKILTSREPKSKDDNINRLSSIKKYTEDIQDADVVAGLQANTKVQDRYQNLVNVSNIGTESGFQTNNSSVGRELKNVNSKSSSKEASAVSGDATGIGDKMVDDVGVFEIKDKAGERISWKSEVLGKEVDTKNSGLDSHIGETSTKLDKNGRYETKLNPAVKDSVKEVDRNKFAKNVEKVENPIQRDESHLKKEKIDDRIGSKGKRKEESASTDKKTKESDSKGKKGVDSKDVDSDTKDDKYEAERGKKTGDKRDHDKKREHGRDGKEDTSRHKSQSSSSKHNRRRSPAAESNGRHRRDNSAVSHGDSSSDDASDDSRRKSRSKRRNLSPSPVKSRKRQVSRSPHSKHSQRSHSLYSSLENTRKRRSRSRSPRRRR